MGETGLRELTSEELSVEEFGEPKEKIAYLVGFLFDAYPSLAEKITVYKAAAYSMKKYGFNVSARAVKQLTGPTDKSLFAKMVFACKAVSKTDESSKTVEEEKSSLEDIAEIKRKMDILEKRGHFIQYPCEGLVDLLMMGKITLEQFHEVEFDEDRARELTKKVLNVG